jgi:hypothetical protein
MENGTAELDEKQERLQGGGREMDRRDQGGGGACLGQSLRS